MPVEIVYETHSTSEDNEDGSLGHRWAPDCLLNGAAFEDLVDAPFGWQAGWTSILPDDLG